MKKFLFFLTVYLSTYAFAQFTQPVGTIKAVHLRSDSDRFSVIITGDGKLEPNTVVTENPPRIALDFPNVKNILYPKVIEAEENSYVHRIRTSLYAKGRETISRLTIELKNRWDYSVLRSKDGIVLTLSPATKTTSGKTTTKSAPSSATVKSPAPSLLPVTPPPSQDIVIGSEDLLEISVFELPQFNTTARVQGDGTITMPLIGSIEVRGLRKKDVEAKIANALQAKYVNNANVSVNVKEYKSRQVSVLGEVKSPGAYYIMSQRSLLQLLSEAGGLSASAGNKCYIFRSGSPKIEINLRDLMVNGNPELNIPIYPGDVVNIPTDAKVVIYVLGAVRQPGAVHLSTSMPVTLLAAIAGAGGPSDSAKQSDIKIKRKNSIGADSLIKVNLKDILKGKAEDIALFEGDIVTVPESFF